MIIHQVSSLQSWSPPIPQVHPSSLHIYNCLQFVPPCKFSIFLFHQILSEPQCQVTLAKLLFLSFCLKLSMKSANSPYFYRLSILLLVLSGFQFSFLCINSKMKNIQTESPGNFCLIILIPPPIRKILGQHTLFNL